MKIYVKFEETSLSQNELFKKYFKVLKKIRNFIFEKYNLNTKCYLTNGTISNTIKKHITRPNHVITLYSDKLMNSFIDRKEIETIIEEQNLSYTLMTDIVNEEQLIRIDFTITHNHQIAATTTNIVNSSIKQNKAIDTIKLTKRYLQTYKNACDRKIEFNLSLKKLNQLLKIKNCQITSVEFVEQDNHIHKMTIDRLDNTKGYIDSNVIAVTHELNQIKDNMQLDHMLKCIQLAKKRKLL